jgi:hypothetical protein
MALSRGCNVDPAIATTQFHRACRCHGCGDARVGISRARAAVRARAAHRRARERPGGGRPGMAGPRHRLCTRASGAGLECRTQLAHRYSLEFGRSQPSQQTRGGIGRAHAGYSRGWRRPSRRGVTAGNANSADRVWECHRSRRRRLRRQLGATGRQYHRLHVVRIQR